MHDVTKTVARRCCLLLLAASIGCDEEPSDPEFDPDAIGDGDLTPRSTYVGENELLPNPASMCWVTGPWGTNLATQSDLDDIEATLLEWLNERNALQLLSDTTNGFAWSHVEGSWYYTNCTTDALGNYEHTLRIYVDTRTYPAQSTPFPDTATVPGCEMGEPVGVQAYDPDTGLPVMTGGLYEAQRPMWSRFPHELLEGPTCLYTTHLYPGQDRNNYLHELGHSLGFSHEHQRADATCQPHGPDPDGIRRITTYDQYSVMHYVQSCVDGTSAPGNWGSDGLTDSDRLGAEILYPTWSNAGMLGRLVGWAGGDQRFVQSDWGARGAITDPATGVLPYFWWLVDGRILSTSPVPSAEELQGIGSGNHEITLYINDLWGRWFVGTAPLEILRSRAAYDTRVAAIPTIGWM